MLFWRRNEDQLSHSLNYRLAIIIDPSEGLPQEWINIQRSR